MRLHASCLALTLLVSIGGHANAAEPAPEIRWEPFEVHSFDGRTSPAQLGHLRVPERRDARNGRIIDIAFVKLPSTARTPGDPIVFLMGGPGVPGSAMAPIPPYFTLFERLRSVSDVILLDQRGLGRSSPVLECPADSVFPTDVFLTHRKLVDALAARTKACADSWRAQGADPCAYNTVESADDLDDLRRGLGVKRISLLGFSYGTRLAMAMLQRHGAGVGRVVLAGLNRPGQPAKRPDAIDRKVASWSDRLAQDSTWKERTDLLAAARAARERLQAKPAVVTVVDRKARTEVSLPVGWEGLTALLALHLDDPRVPALLVSVAAGDDSVLARMVEGDYNGVGGAPTGLMARAVSCASGRGVEAMPSRADSTSFFGEPVDNDFLRDPFCASLGCDDVPADFPGAFRSDAPALVILGSFDQTTPVTGAEVGSWFPRAKVLSVIDAGHETLPIAAVQDAVLSFFRDGTITTPRVTADAPVPTSVAEARRGAGRRR